MAQGEAVGAEGLLQRRAEDARLDQRAAREAAVDLDAPGPAGRGRWRRRRGLLAGRLDAAGRGGTAAVGDGGKAARVAPGEHGHDLGLVRG